ncbi:MAG: DUF1573 domain-containing protein [Prolixibacteraceae bacterium]
MKRLFFVLALMVGFISVKAQDAAVVDSTSKAKIVFKEVTHNFGTIAKAGDGSCVFKFTNEGNIPLVLSNVQSSCGCTTPSWTKDPVLPGNTGEIKVKYDTNRVGAFSKTITVTSNAERIVLKIAGTVEGA